MQPLPTPPWLPLKTGGPASVQRMLTVCRAHAGHSEMPEVEVLPSKVPSLPTHTQQILKVILRLN